MPVSPFHFYKYAVGWFRVASTLIWAWGCVAGDKWIVLNQSPTGSQETKWCQNLLFCPVASENELFQLVLTATLAWVLSCFTWVPLFVTLWTVACQAPLWGSPGKNTGVGCRALLQGIFLSQGSNQHLLTAPALTGWLFATSTTLLLLFSYSVVSDFVTAWTPCSTPGFPVLHSLLEFA